MKTIHPIFKTSKVIDYLSTLITEYEYTSYSELSHGDKCEFSGLLIEAAGYGDVECITEAPDLEQTVNALRKALIGGQPHDDEELLFVIKDNAVRYYDEIMHALFEETFAEYQAERHEFLSYARKYGDPDDISMESSI